MNTLNQEEKEAPGKAGLEKREWYPQPIKDAASGPVKPLELKKEVTTPHDSVVQKFLQENETVKSLFREYLPREILSLIDLDSLEFMKDKFVDEVLDRFYSDFLYKVKFAGSLGYLYPGFPVPVAGYEQSPGWKYHGSACLENPVNVS